MFECAATDVNNKTDNDAAETGVFVQNIRFLSDGCCCLDDTGNKILFRFHWKRVNEVFRAAPEEEVKLCEVR
jgi:hypothetical protein